MSKISALHKKENSKLNLKVEFGILVEVTGLDRLLRILYACRPNASHSVPDYTLSTKNLPLATFINAETFSGSRPYTRKKKAATTKWS